MSIAFNTHFDPYYDQFSVNRLDFSLPDYFDVYAPDNQDDFNCLAVCTPSPQRGAQRWTNNGRWITLGIYRDEGRDAEQRPPVAALNWTRNLKVLTITDPNGHKLRLGDLVSLFNVNVPLVNVPVVSVPNNNTFTVLTMLYGATSGSNGAYQPSGLYNFFEQNYVFRLLPSFKLVRWIDVLAIFNSCAPNPDPTQRELYNVTLESTVKLPRGKNNTVNYDLPTVASPTLDRLPLARRFGQVYDETGTPLPLKYNPLGFPVAVNEIDTPHKNNGPDFGSPMTNESSDQSTDSRVYAYDFYGLDVNDPTRGPFFTTDNVYRDESVDGSIGNIMRLTQNGVPHYAKPLYDGFGNLVIGIQPNNALVTRRNVLPLTLDNFNKPVKRPSRRN